MVKKIYLDSSVISALFDERTPERMQMTCDVWEFIRQHDVYISETVVEELTMAKEPLASKFKQAIKGFNVLKSEEQADVNELALVYVEAGIFPEKYLDDATHVAVCSINDIGLLLSWNFKHLVKIKTRRMVQAINLLKGHCHVEILAPPEL